MMKPEIQRVLDYLSEMNIRCDIVEHPAVYTIEEMDSLHIDEGSQVVKNLFVRDDKKKRYFLISVQKDKRVNLDDIRTKLGSRRLSFASESTLQEILGLNKGAVTPLGILNDEACSVEVVLDSELRHFQRIGIHPNENTATLWIQPQQLEAVVKRHGNPLSYVEIS